MVVHHPAYLMVTTMKWFELSIKVPDEFVEPVSYLFNKYGHVFSIEDVGDDWFLMRTYLSKRARQSFARIEIGIRLIASLRDIGELEVKTLEKREWQEEWKRYFHVLKVGHSLIIKPSWLAYEVQPGDRVLELDPGMAFGTGYHPSTRTCLEALEKWICSGMKVLDLGTGSGILTIGAIRLGADFVTALDIDSSAIKAARQNVKGAGLRDVVRLTKGTLPHFWVQPGSVDLVVANINATIIEEKASQLLTALGPGGVLIVSGIVESRRKELERIFQKLRLAQLETYSQDGWCTLVYKNHG